MSCFQFLNLFVLKSKHNIIQRPKQCEVIMPLNIFLPLLLLCLPREYYVCPHVHIHHSKKESLDVKIEIWLKLITLLLHHNVPLCFQFEAILTTCYLINKMPSFVPQHNVPNFIVSWSAIIFSFSPCIQLHVFCS